MIVYLITNKINRKRYVGITTRSMQSRFLQHCQDAYSKKTKKYAIHNAILKYGKENFIIEQIDIAINKDELIQKEIYWIEKLGTFGKEYNLTKGGDGNSGFSYSKERLEEMSKAATKRMKSKKLRKHLSRKTLEYFEKHPEEREKRRLSSLGNVPSKETCEKISKANLGKKKKWTKEGKHRLIEFQRTRVRGPSSDKVREVHRTMWTENNPMNDPEKRKLVGLSKVGRKRFYREDGSFYLSYPANPIDPQKSS